MKTLLTSLAFLAAIITSAAAENCAHQAEQPEPVIVLGSIVQPSASIVIIGDCAASYDELHDSYLAADKRDALIKITRNKSGQIVGNGDY